MRVPRRSCCGFATYNRRMKLRLLANLTPREFLRRHWQKRSLFVPGALPGFRDLLDARALAAFASRNDVESRIVEREGRRWETRHGPFRKFRLKTRNATVLVSGLNLHLSPADRLLRRFKFIPQARLDDVMVSYATPGGGVGPHTDTYDVFLLQGSGRRRWRVWNPRGGVADYLCGPGDLLYLPPGWKHDGVALDACTTYSIGFRAPRGTELSAAFLDFLHQRGFPESAYRDPGLRPASSSALIPSALMKFGLRTLSRIRWSRADAQKFLGEYLSMPKQNVVFRPRASRRALSRSVVRLDPSTQLLYSGPRFFINGEALVVPARAAPSLRKLADTRSAQGARLAGSAAAELILAWQKLGYLHFERP